MTAFKIETRRGWFCRPERIGGMSFPAELGASFHGATLYLSRYAARVDIERFHLDGAHAEEVTLDTEGHCALKGNYEHSNA